MASPFDPDPTDAWERWRDAKRAAAPVAGDPVVVELRDLRAPTEAELAALRGLAGRANFACYAAPDVGEDRRAVLNLGHLLGLRRADRNYLADEQAISAIRAGAEGERGYVPYTRKPLKWHTDGYYNTGDDAIRAFTLHCVRPAAEGGENRLLDPEIAYLLLRERDPALVRALMRPDALGIPPREEAGSVARPAITGPVFAIEPDGSLRMRYTARGRNVRWADHPAVAAARAALAELLATELPYVHRLRLEAGTGLVCNNVLHDRSGFNDPSDGPGRLLYRARYRERIAET